MAARETLSRTWLMLEKKSDGLLERCTCRPDELHTSRRMDLWAGARASARVGALSCSPPTHLVLTSPAMSSSGVLHVLWLRSGRTECSATK
jgi:hypothetical protein